MTLAREADRVARAAKRLYPKQAIRAARRRHRAVKKAAQDFARYRHDPVGFIRDVLGVTLTPDQEDIARACPGRVKVNAGHGTGKSFLCACLCLWWFHTRNPSVVITTAPTLRDVVDLLWTEIRLLTLRARVKLPEFFIGPRAPEMFDHDEHWGKGYTSSRGESFQGRHRPSMLFVFDESEAVDPVYWTTTNTMYQPDMDHCWLAIGNPTTTASQSYVEDMATAADGTPKWKLFTLSCLSHPNIAAQLRSLPPPVPNAVSLAQVAQFVQDWATPISPREAKGDDFEWPPGSGVWYRPGPLFMGRVLGKRPVDGVDTVWGAEAWQRAITPKFTPHSQWLLKAGIVVGVDPASYGDDMTAIHVRCGALSLHHESHNGWMPERTAARLKDLCHEWSHFYNTLAGDDRPPLLPRDVRVIVELDGPGLAVLSHGSGVDWPNWSALSVSWASEVLDPMGRPCYWNMRSQIWAEGAKIARQGGVDLSRLPQDVLHRLRQQLTTPSYHIDGSGKTVVESKDDIKERLGRSPDDADSFLICHANVPSWNPCVVGRVAER